MPFPEAITQALCKYDEKFNLTKSGVANFYNYLQKGGLNYPFYVEPKAITDLKKLKNTVEQDDKTSTELKTVNQDGKLLKGSDQRIDIKIYQCFLFNEEPKWGNIAYEAYQEVYQTVLNLLNIHKKKLSIVIALLRTSKRTS